VCTALTHSYFQIYNSKCTFLFAMHKRPVPKKKPAISVPDSIRINDYTTYYVGPERSDPYLSRKRARDMVAAKLMVAPPSLQHFTATQRSHPKNYDINVTKHQKPLFVTPDTFGATRMIRGGAEYNQAVQTKIAELATISQTNSIPSNFSSMQGMVRPTFPSAMPVGL